MANNKRNELEFCLPSDFLTDEDIHINTSYRISDSTSDRFRFPTAFPKHCASFNTASALSSPVDSIFGFTETESEEEDSILSELTRQLTQKFSPVYQPITNEKNLLQLGSPQSTLIADVESWSGRSTVSSKGSSNGTSRVSSPPSTPLESNNKAWGLIYKAAALVEGLKSNGTGGQPSLINSGIFERQRSFSTHPPPSNSSIHSPIQPIDFVRIEELLGQQSCGMRSSQVIYNPNGCNLDRNVAGRVISSGDSTTMYGGTWPNMQFGNKNHQQPGTGVTGGRLLPGGGFGVGSVIKSQRVGTGVFLPRKYGDNSSCNSVDARKKSGYSSAYSANKVPVISNNLSNMSGFTECHSQKMHSNTIADYEALGRRGSMLNVQRTTSFPEVAINHELHLPHEWTY